MSDPVAQSINQNPAAETAEFLFDNAQFSRCLVAQRVSILCAAGGEQREMGGLGISLTLPRAISNLGVWSATMFLLLGSRLTCARTRFISSDLLHLTQHLVRFLRIGPWWRLATFERAGHQCALISS